MIHSVKAFSLIEVVVMITAGSLFLLAGTSLAMASFSSLSTNISRIEATFKTTECMELVRNVRDTSWRQNMPWDCAFDDGVFTIESSPLPAISTDKLNCRSDLGVKISPFDDLGGGITATFLSIERVDDSQVKFSCTTRQGDERTTMTQILSNWLRSS